MLVDTREAKCVLGILRLLDRGKSKYSVMFKKTKVSHTTLQRVLKELVEKKLVKKHDIGHMKVDYEITKKGEKFLELLLQLKEMRK